MFKPNDDVVKEAERVLRESAEFAAAVEKAKREGEGVLYDFLGQQATLPEYKPPPRPLTPMEQKLAEMRRVGELCRRPLR